MASPTDDKKKVEKKEGFLTKYKMYIIVAAVLILGGAAYWHFIYKNQGDAATIAGAHPPSGAAASVGAYAPPGSAIPQSSAPGDKFRFY
jgi:hypothetical protein